MNASSSPPLSTLAAPAGPRSRAKAVHYVSAALVSIATTAITAPLSRNLDLANVVMLYPLAVLLVALRLGRGPAVLAAFLNVALFDFFLVPPYYTFAVADVQYLLTFAVMLVVALITGHLVADLQTQADTISRREKRTQALYELARDLGAAVTMEDVDGRVRSFTKEIVGVRVNMFLVGANGELRLLPGAGDSLPVDPEMVRIAAAGSNFTDIDITHPVRYQPMKAAGKVCGVLAFASTGTSALAEHADLLEAVASLAAIAVARTRYAEAAASGRTPDLDRARAAYALLLTSDLDNTVRAVKSLHDALHGAEAPAALPAEWSRLSAIVDETFERLNAASQAPRS